MGKHKLTHEQENVVSWLNAGYNVFLTGVAGTGKTTALNEWLAQVPANRFVGIAASTGIAATHIGGQTLHSWLGATPERDTVQRLCNASWMKKHGPRLRAVKSLVIDEISMVDGNLFTLAEAAHRIVRDSAQPWGGVQVILVGDLGQLPPVDERDAGWCWQSKAWQESRIHVLELQHVLRQQDQQFADLLKRIRVGMLDQYGYQLLAARVNAYDPNEPGVVRLMTHNAQADLVNDEKLALVAGEERCYKALDHGDEPHLGQIRKSCLSPEQLRLKVGARVMFTKNDFEFGRWVNGTMGVVEELRDLDIVVQIDGGDHVNVMRATGSKKEWGDNGELREKASRTQFPLRLAWAITIHKSQGCTFNRASMNLAETFAPGQAYVALSRCRTLEGVNIEAWKGAESIRAHPLLQARAS